MLAPIPVRVFDISSLINNHVKPKKVPKVPKLNPNAKSFSPSFKNISCK